MATARDHQRCSVHRAATFSLSTPPNNANRALNDILDAFPFTEAAIEVPSRQKTPMSNLLRELNMDMSKISVNPPAISSEVDLVVVMGGAELPRLPTLGVVIEMNGRSSHPPFPLPNKTPESAEYSEKILRFLTAKKRDVLRCNRCN